MPNRRLRTLTSASPEFAWLGAEALPGGLVRVSDEVQAAIGAEWRETRPSDAVRPVGLISIMQRLMHKATRLN